MQTNGTEMSSGGTVGSIGSPVVQSRPQAGTVVKLDQAKMALDPIFKSRLEPDEDIIYSLELTQITRGGSKKTRVLVLTNRYCFNLRSTGMLNSTISFFCNCWKVKNRLPLISIDLILYDNRSNHFVISSPDFVDLLFESEEKDQAMDYLYHARKLANCENYLTVGIKKPSFMMDFILTAGKSQGSNTKRKIEDLIKVSHDDFCINFCGKHMISENLLNTGTKIQLSDFRFYKNLGVGGFSKVYLTIYKQTNELFAIKVIRLPNTNDNVDYRLQIQHERDI
jgi:hypothetical protein